MVCISNAIFRVGMKKLNFLLLFLLLTLGSTAQVVFKTIVSSGPVVVNEPFQVQYVLENVDERDEFIAPKFKSLNFVSGPYEYVGSFTMNGVTRNLRNLAFTFSASKPGRYIIPGGTVKSGNKILKGENSFIVVISNEEAIRRGLKSEYAPINDEYFLRPGEDPQAKIRRNLFMKLTVDRKTCYIGQPVTATFKLYSRVQSKAEIVKNPGFYGFTVQDMIGLQDRALTQEVVNGKKFDVHTIRKIQLYPLREGSYTIDPMELQNRVYFSRSGVSRNKEQEIVEGIFPEPFDSPDANSVAYDYRMGTEPVKIEVKPTPALNKPVEFNGATGHFKVSAELSNRDLKVNEQGELIVKIIGKGNFTQLVAPIINWPQGIENFEPKVADSLDHSFTPMTGTRTFRYGFIANKAGNYKIPAFEFSFFDPDSNRYKSVTAAEIEVEIGKAEKKEFSVAGSLQSKISNGNGMLIWVLLAIAVILGVITGFIIWKRKKKTKANIPETPIVRLPTVKEILVPASILSQTETRAFYTTLRDSIWSFFRLYFGLAGSGMSKSSLNAVMDQNRIDKADKEVVLHILDECETGIFTSIEAMTNQQELLEQTRSVLEKIKTGIVNRE